MSLCDWSATMSQGKTLEVLETLALSHARESGPYSAALLDMLNRRTGQRSVSTNLTTT